MPPRTGSTSPSGWAKDRCIPLAGFGIQSGDYEEGGGSTDPDAKIQALIAQTVEKKFGRLQATGDHGLGGRNGQHRNGNQETRACFECGEVGHIRRNCPKRNGNSTNPRHITPKQGESKDRMINGVPHKWCGKCRGGKGPWTVGDGAHCTHEHRGANAETAGQNESANLSQEVAEETANMAESPSYVNEPLGEKI